MVGGRTEGRGKERQVVVGRLPLCEEENKQPGLDLEKCWETVHGSICILQKKEGKKPHQSKLRRHARLRNACQDSKSRLA